MNDIAYIFSHLVSGLVDTGTIYIFFRSFFIEDNSKRRRLYIAFILYYVINQCIYFFLNIPVVIMTCNICSLFLISFCFESSIYKKCLSVVFIYIICMLVETIGAVFSGICISNFYEVNVDYHSVTGLFFVRLITYFIVLLLSKYKNIKRGEIVPKHYWIIFISMPVITLHIFLSFLSMKRNEVIILSIVIGLLLINMVFFYLYDKTISSIKKQYEINFHKKQIQFYDKQMTIMRDSVKLTEKIDHDLKNHLFSIKSFLDNKKFDLATEHLLDILDYNVSVKNYISTDNFIIDSIINYKISTSSNLNIEFIKDIMIPADLKLNSFKMTVILGNLLDNAIEASLKLESNRRILINIKYDKGRLIINISNTFNGIINGTLHKISTTKSSRKHGIGLKNIREVVENDNGLFKIDIKNNMFSAWCLIYI
ncbi:sensor histidine kinase [Massilimicrobiota sp. An134]|uniref:sensor histidine kinase n=1 Tax=Massilimicrobiota sp. An134 TaxID=1965557 RepID=UPI0013026C95|nr:sensor histidine kinase [Massilimicrobiota sp. An134]